MNDVVINGASIIILRDNPLKPIFDEIDKLSESDLLELQEYVENKTKKEIRLYYLGLTDYDSNKKISVIKLIKQQTNLGLRESKDIADNKPSIVQISSDLKTLKEAANLYRDINCTMTIIYDENELKKYKISEHLHEQ